MKVLKIVPTLFAATAATMLLVSCTPQESADHHGDHDEKHDHDHAEHGHEAHAGPHQGQVIELGRNHKYHAELVKNEDSKTVTVYILDKDLKQLPIATESIALNLVVEGTPKTFELTATDTQEGKTSRFDSADNALHAALHQHEASGNLQVTIDGTPVTGKVEHHHHEEEHRH